MSTVIDKLIWIHPISVVYQGFFIFSFIRNGINPTWPIFFCVWGAFWCGVYRKEFLWMPE